MKALWFARICLSSTLLTSLSFGLVAQVQESTKTIQKDKAVSITNSNATASASTTNLVKVKVSKGVAEIVQLTKAGIDPKVIETYMSVSGRAYVPTTDEIIYMQQQGVAKEIMVRLIGQGGDLRARVILAGMEKEQAHEAEIARIRASMHGWAGNGSIFTDAGPAPWLGAWYVPTFRSSPAYYSFDFMGLPNWNSGLNRSYRGVGPAGFHHLRNRSGGRLPPQAGIGFQGHRR